jgi:hypothetical protein
VGDCLIVFGCVFVSVWVGVIVLFDVCGFWCFVLVVFGVGVFKCCGVGWCMRGIMGGDCCVWFLFVGGDLYRILVVIVLMYEIGSWVNGVS